MRFRRIAVVTGTTLALGLGGLTLGSGMASATDWDAVAQCESSGNWSTSTGNGFHGGLQFTPSTWAANGGTGSPENASREEQIRVAENVKATQGMGAWPVCGSRGGGGSTSGKTSNSSATNSASGKVKTSSPEVQTAAATTTVHKTSNSTGKTAHKVAHKKNYKTSHHHCNN